MIPCLYGPLTTDFTTFGIGHLSDVIAPHVVEERNGEFTLEFQYPIDGAHYDDIGLRYIVTAKPSPAQDVQPFRVVRISRPINGIVTVYARHIRYDLEGFPVAPFSAVGIVNALAAIKSNSLVQHNFTFTTTKTSTGTMTLLAPASTLSLLGGTSGSLLDLYGGEYKYDIWNVQLLNARGSNTGMVVRYGVDLIDFQQEENCSNVYTAVMCYWKSADDDSTVVTGSVVSAGTFSYDRILVIDKSQDYEEAPTVATLDEYSANYINQNAVGVPKVAINMSFANLEQTEEYENIRQSVELCDYVTVEFEKLGVSATAKIIRTDYDVINERYISVSIGDSRTSLADSFVAVQAKADSAPTTQQMQSVINATTAAIIGAKGGAVRLLDTNGDKMPDTLYIADDPDPLRASKVWRFNYEGWGASQNGYDGPYEMGATFAAGLIADFITAGTLDASIVSVENLNADNITSGTINADSINVTNINGHNIKEATITSTPIASSAITSSKIGNLAVTESKIGSYAVSNGKLGASSVSYEKTSFTGTLDQVGVNKSNIEALYGYFTGSAHFSSLTADTYWLDGKALYFDAQNYVRGASYD